MITKETAALIWHCYREIKTAEQLLTDLKELREHPDDPHAPKLQDVFGRHRDLELGVPSGESSHRLFRVSPLLAESIIRSHIQNKMAELVAANERARFEIDAEAKGANEG